MEKPKFLHLVPKEAAHADARYRRRSKQAVTSKRQADCYAGQCSGYKHLK